MVSGTQCPAWSDQLKDWIRCGTVPSKGQCPVRHRNEYKYIRIFPLKVLNFSSTFFNGSITKINYKTEKKIDFNIVM